MAVEGVPFLVYLDAPTGGRAVWPWWLIDHEGKEVQGEKIDVYDVAFLIAMAQDQRAAGVESETYTVLHGSVC
jgi:hypothetical protein